MDTIKELEVAAWQLGCQTMGGDVGYILSWSQSGAGLCNRLQGEEYEVPLIRKSDADARDAMRLGRIAELEKIKRSAESALDKSQATNVELRAKWRTEHDTANAHIMAHDALRTELAALKAQEPVAFLRYARSVAGFENEMPHVVSCNTLPDGLYPVYAAPVAKQEVVMPPRIYGNPYSRGWNACLDEVARLNGGKP